MATSVDTRVKTRVVTLAANDRCDRCLAQANVETALLGGGSLLWCSHHYNSNAVALKQCGAYVVCDQRAT